MGALRRVNEDTAELKRMRVSPSLQRLGRQMLHALETRTRDLGYTAIVLDTNDRQTAAIALYQAHDYLETGRGELAEDVPGLVELEVAVPRSTPASR